MNVSKFERKKQIDSFNEFGRVIFPNDSGELEELHRLKYGDIVSGAEYTATSIVGESIEFGEIKLQYKNEDKYNQLLEALRVKPLAIEVFLYENEILEENQYNLFYFLEENSEENNFSQHERIKNIKGYAFEKAIEDNTVVEHTVEYTTIKTDDQGNPIEPKNFNKVSYSGKTGDIIYRVYQDNLISPVPRNKGKAHSGIDTTRKIKGFDYFEYLASDIWGTNQDYLDEKKTLLEMRRQLYQVEKRTNYFLPNIRLKIINNRFVIRYKFTNTIVIDREEESNKAIYFKKEESFSNSKNDVLVESDKVDFCFIRKTRDRPNHWKIKEKIGTNSPDEGSDDNPILPCTEPYIAPLKRKADEELGNGTPKKTIEIEIDLSSYEYFKTIDPHQIIRVENYDNDYNGSYRVDKISAVVEQTYVSYSLEKLTKLEGV